jgi:hypothetical protein
MTPTLHNDAATDSRRKRRGLLLLLLLSAIALAWVFPAASAGFLDGFAARAPQAPSFTAPSATPSVVPVVATPTASGLKIGAGTALMEGVDFTISGGGASNLRLGVATVVRLTLTNPNEVPIFVTALTVTVSDDGGAGCSSAGNLQIAQSNASTADPITVPAGSAITLASAPRAPQIALLNRPDVNQDACKGKVFHLVYSGSAHS